MRNRFRRIICVAHFIGRLLQILGILLLIPLAVVFARWEHSGEGMRTLAAFAIPAVLCFSVGTMLRVVFVAGTLDTAGSMLLCALSWIFASAFGAMPFAIAAELDYFNAYFEAVSGFTTTGITMFADLEVLPYSILFWRSLAQWLGGIGILSFFLFITYRGSGAHHIFGAESHKIASSRPKPGLYNTLRVVWGIYLLFSALCWSALVLEKMPIFDAICHTLTTVSTGGFSPYNASIGFYRLSGHPNFRLIEYTIALFMLLGGINFLVHYRVMTGDVRALWDNIEIRYWWRLIAGFVLIVLIDHLRRSGLLSAWFVEGKPVTWTDLEHGFRTGLFQVIAIITSTGYSTQDIGSGFFGAMSRQLFLLMMVIGGCVGSTSGGFKVMRVAILNRLVRREVFKARVSDRASLELVIDGKPVPAEEVHRVTALFFAWLLLIIVGGGITALWSSQSALQSWSGMFSAVGNIGPCYIPVQEMIGLHWFVKVTYIIGMLAGRLEILPVLLLFSRKAWR